MGKTLKNLPEGQDFNDSHFKDSGFGFSGSAEPKSATQTHGKPEGKKPASKSKPKKGSAGGALNQMPQDQAPGPIERHADGGYTAHHPDGRRVRHFTNGAHAIFHADGRVDNHYPDGGHSTAYPDGRTSHHHADGRIEHRHPDGRIVIHGADGSVDEHDASEYAHGGRARCDGGELHLARGGAVRTRLPRSMVPKAAKIRGPISAGRAAARVNRPPRNPTRTPTPRNDMPGGQAPYGVEPSAEPDIAGSDQTGIPQLKKGGRVRKRG